MNKPFTFIAAAGAAAICTSAWASGLDEKLQLGDFTAPGGGSTVVDILVGSNPNPVVGFSVSFDWNDDNGVNTGAWGSDLQIDILAPDGSSRSIGGFDGAEDLVYDFQGSASDLPGFYSSGPHLVWEPDGIQRGGVWSFTLTNDFSFNGTVTWKNISITLHKIVPAPGALALLGMAGVAGVRRRRRN